MAHKGGHDGSCRTKVELIPFESGLSGRGSPLVPGGRPRTRVAAFIGFEKLEGRDRYDIFLWTPHAPLGEMGTSTGGATFRYVCEHDGSGGNVYCTSKITSCSPGDWVPGEGPSTPVS